MKLEEMLSAIAGSRMMAVLKALVDEPATAEELAARFNKPLPHGYNWMTKLVRSGLVRYTVTPNAGRGTRTYFLTPRVAKWLKEAACFARGDVE